MRKRPKIFCLVHEDSPMNIFCFQAFQKLECAVESYAIKGKVLTEGVVSFDYMKFLERLLTFSPDILFVMNVNGLDAYGGIADVCRENNIKIACWFIDNPFYSFSLWESFIGFENIYCFVWDKFYLDAVKAHQKKVIYLPQAASPENFYPKELTPEEKKHFQSSLSFTGNLGLNYLFNLIEGFRKDYCQGIKNIDSWFLQASQIAIQQSRTDLRKIFQEMSLYFPEVSLDFKSDRIFYRAQKILEASLSVIIRLSIIRNLLPLGIQVWGLREWEEKISPEHYRGPAVYMRDIPKIYNATDINVDISRFQQRMGTNQRIFDVPACGGFLITDYKKELEELFDKDEIVDYKDTDELIHQIHFYKNKPELRKLVVQRARKRVLESHTYEKRMQKILDEISGDIDSSGLKVAPPRKEIQAWQNYFLGIVQEKKGDHKSSEDSFKKAVSFSSSVKKAVKKKLWQREGEM
ncbi:MAG: glycosyltransferase [Candidatus Aureabacteria bacterium]|nr:glycosyltransferase [Candidatus Auribacterota bacterium]